MFRWGVLGLRCYSLEGGEDVEECRGLPIQLLQSELYIIHALSELKNQPVKNVHVVLHLLVWDGVRDRLWKW
jgi:hypothetical protein